MLQSVLDGRTGSWLISTGWFGTPSLPWGNGFRTQAGDTVEFQYLKVGSNWTTTLGKVGTSTKATNTFDLGECSLGSLIFEIEILMPVSDIVQPRQYIIDPGLVRR